MDYKTSGVDVQAGRDFVDRIKSSVEATHRKEVLGGIGGFGGCIRIPSGYVNPVLVSGADGVGTKLDLAQKYGAHFSVGIDLVAMCVNDVITNGALPLFFLDYIATGVLSPESLVEVIEGISHGCKISNCSLLGGETAEMPGFYSQGKYDLAGFCVGIVEESNLVDSKSVIPGDQIVAIGSNGLHSNGFSLVRKVLSMSGVNERSTFGKSEEKLLEFLLEPTAIYAELVRSILDLKIPIHSMAHITGGGLPENLPRCLPSGLCAAIDRKTWSVPEIFQWMQLSGDIPESDLWNTFNMGVGFCLVLPSESVDTTLQICTKHGFKSWIIGQVQEVQMSSEQQLVGLPL